ncbi:MAG: hypothetical protein FJW39_17200 [Acidobacteria bacterium]|nr:hypothetical protein [Acidobacteriota bacterium]
MNRVVMAALAFGILMAWPQYQWPWRLEQIVLLGCAAVAMWQHTGRWQRPLLILLAPAAIAAIQLATGNTVYPWATRNAIVTWLSWCAAAWLGARIPPRTAVRALVIFATAVAAVATVTNFIAPGKAFGLFATRYESRIMGPFEYPNQFAAFVELAVPAALAGMSTAGIVTAAVLAVSVVASGSVGGTIIVFAEMIAVWALTSWRARESRSRAFRGAAGLGALVAAFALVTGWEILEEKFFRGLSWPERVVLTKSTIAMAASRPITGWGLGTWDLVYPRYATFDDALHDNQTHNDWAQWTAEGGLPMLAAMVVIALMFARAGWKTLYGLGLAAVLIHCIAEYHFQQRPAFGAFYFAWAGAVWAASTSPSASTREPIPELAPTARGS